MDPFAIGTTISLQDAVDYSQAHPITGTNTNPQFLALPDSPTSQPKSPAYGHTLDYRTYKKEVEVFVCATGACNKEYSRKPDLIRHQRGAHQGNQRFKCHIGMCKRAKRGFARSDKRDDHERRVHAKRGSGRCVRDQSGRMDVVAVYEEYHSRKEHMVRAVSWQVEKY